MNALIVAGSRHMTCAEHCVIAANACEAFVARYWRPDVVIHGACRDRNGNPAGADWMGERATIAFLASMFGVAKGTIGPIVRGTGWRHA